MSINMKEIFKELDAALGTEDSDVSDEYLAWLEESTANAGIPTALVIEQAVYTCKGCSAEHHSRPTLFLESEVRSATILREVPLEVARELYVGHINIEHRYHNRGTFLCPECLKNALTEGGVA